MEIGGEAGVVEHNDGDQRSNLNISDVFEAISNADPSFGAGGVEDAMYRAPAPAADARPYVRIVEQPASKALRFRYECEGRSAGSIPGVNSTSERKTYPTIEICGHKGRAVVVVSCVTRDKPYRPHPHNLVGRELCKKGVCTVHVSGDSSLVSFSNLGIQCVKRKDIADALRVREEMRVDPFKTGFSHKSQPQSIDLNAVRLCFQVFLPEERTGKIRHALPPVVSDVIYDKKAMSDLVIMRLSRCSGPLQGGTEVILLCEKVTREDTAVVFFQKENEQVVWEDSANIILVHKQVAIAFHTPPYRNPYCSDHVQVYIQLKRLSDDARSIPVSFEYIPNYADSEHLKYKRRKPLMLSAYDQERVFQPEQKPIKSEPRDKTPPHPMSSPPLRMFSPQYGDHDPAQDRHYQQWAMPVDTMQPGLSVPGPSHMSQYSPQEMAWAGPGYAQSISPNMQTMSPNMQAMSPNMQTMSPNMQTIPPNVQAMSPNMQAMSPMGQVMSPNMHGNMSPNMGHASPNMGHVSPNMGHVSPNLGHVPTNMQPNLSMLPQQTMMETTAASDPPSITGLLMDRGDAMPQLNSSELSGLSSLLGDRGPDLSDSLNRLSTTDLLHHTDLQ